MFEKTKGVLCGVLCGMLCGVLCGMRCGVLCGMLNGMLDGMLRGMVDGVLCGMLHGMQHTSGALLHGVCRDLYTSHTTLAWVCCTVGYISMPWGMPCMLAPLCCMGLLHGTAGTGMLGLWPRYGVPAMADVWGALGYG